MQFFSPDYTRAHKFYQANGSGRDKYIYFNSGGLKFNYKNKSNNVLDKQPNSQYANFSKFNRKITEKNLNIKHYKADGSGRDKYILVNEGGQSIPYVHNNLPDSYFHNNLRHYEKISNIKKNDYFTMAQLQTKRQFPYFYHRYQTQKCQELSLPKIKKNNSSIEYSNLNQSLTPRCKPAKSTNLRKIYLKTQM